MPHPSRKSEQRCEEEKRNRKNRAREASDGGARQGAGTHYFTPTRLNWKAKKVGRNFFFPKSSKSKALLKAFKSQMHSTMWATCWAREHHTKLTSKRTGYLQTNGSSKQYHCCQGSFQQESDQKTSQADLIDHQRPATELSCHTSISLVGQTLWQRNSYRRTSVKKPEKDLNFKAVGESRWRNYSCDSRENKTVHFT